MSGLPQIDSWREPDEAFQFEWARQVLSDALERTRLACHQEDQAAHWEAFELKVLRAIRNGAQPSNEQVATETGIDVAKVSQRVQTVKRKLQASVRQVLYESVRNQDELDAEYLLVLERLCAVRVPRDAE